MALGQPALQGARHELAAVVTADVSRYPTLGNQSFHDFDQVGCCELAGDVESQALPSVLVEHREDAQLAAVVGAVADEVPAPDVVDALRLGGDGAGGAATSAGPFGPALDPQPMLAPDALHELASHLPAFAAQEAHELAIAQARILVGEPLDRSVQTQRPVGGLLGFMAMVGTVDAQVPTCLSLRAESGFDHALDRSSLLQRASLFLRSLPPGCGSSSRLAALHL